MPPTIHLADTVRLRIREEMMRRGISQRDLSDQLQWSHGRLGKVLTGRTDLTVNDMADLCQMLGLSVVEAVRDRGLEFLATMTPTELRILERIRQLPDAIDAIMVLLDVNRHTQPQGRRAAPVRPPRPPRNKP
jgi:transcriptional regulator with XRE-family HTH domain